VLKPLEPAIVKSRDNAMPAMSLKKVLGVTFGTPTWAAFSGGEAVDGVRQTIFMRLNRLLRSVNRSLPAVIALALLMLICPRSILRAQDTGGGGDQFNSNSDDSGDGDGDSYNSNSDDDEGSSEGGRATAVPYPTPPPRFPCGPNALENQAWGGPAASSFLGALSALIVPNCMPRPAPTRDSCPKLTNQDTQNAWSISNAQQLARAIFAHYKSDKNPAAEPIGIYRVINQPRCTYLVLLAGTEFHVHQANNFFTDVLSSPALRNEYFVDIEDAIYSNVPAGARLIFAGHSLGGMESQNVAADEQIRRLYHPIRIVTFGSPKTIDDQCQVVRFATEPDVVPWLAVGSWTGGFLGFTWIYNPKQVMESAAGLIGAILAHLSYPDLTDLSHYDATGRRSGSPQWTNLTLAKGVSVPAPGFLLP
jgi:hypothetical protein